MVGRLKKSERGIALLAVLMSVALMTILVVDFTTSTALGYRAAANQANELRAEYLPTSRNDACLQFLVGSGLSRDGNTWVWSADGEYPRPSGVNIASAASAEPGMSTRVSQ